MAKYTQVRKSLNFAGDIEYCMQLDAEHSVILRYKEPQTEDFLDAACDQIVAEETAEKEKQEKIDKAIAEAFMTDEEKANLL